VPDDRFADLGPRERDGEPDPGARQHGDERDPGPRERADEPDPGRRGQDGEPERPRAAEQLAELDAREPPREVRRVQRPYTWVVGVAAVIAIVVVSVKTLPNAGVATHGPAVGKPLPRFAAPSALGAVNGDPNVKQSAADTSTPNRTPACDVRGAGVINICELERPALAITFIGPGTAECDAYVDRLQRLSSSFPQTTFVVVVSGRPKSTVAALARRHGWTMPVAVDRNFAVEERYRVSLDFCATTTFASRGGIVRSNAVPAQKSSDAELRATIRALR